MLLSSSVAAQQFTGAMEKSLTKDCIGEPRFVELPEEGMASHELDSLMKRWSEKEEAHWKAGKVSGTVYHAGAEVVDISLAGKAFTHHGSSCANLKMWLLLQRESMRKP